MIFVIYLKILQIKEYGFSKFSATVFFFNLVFLMGRSSVRHLEVKRRMMLFSIEDHRFYRLIGRFFYR